VIYLAVADDAAAATTAATAAADVGEEGKVGIYANDTEDPTAFYIVGFGKGGVVIPKYTLTARR